MISSFPHTYTATLSKSGASLAELNSEGAASMLAGAPVQFGGQEGYWSPETLLLASLALCFFTTLESLAKREKIEILDFVANTKAQLDKTKDGLVFTKMELKIDVKSNKDKINEVENLIEKSKKYCIISNALKPEISVMATVSPA